MKDLKFTSKTLYYCLLGVIGLLIIGLIAGTYFANQVLNGQSVQLLDARVQSQALDQQSEQLTRTRADIEKYRSLSQIAKGVVPQDKDQAATVHELSILAGKNNVPIASITFPNSTLGGTSVPGTTAAAPATTSKAGLSQLMPAVGLTGVYMMPITVTSDVNKPIPYSSFIAFLSSLEKNRRTALISSMSLQPSKTVTGAVSFTLIIDEYVKP